MPRDRDVQPFEDRAPTYESDWRGKMHLEIASRTLELALTVNATPRRVLDVGCGTGMLLRLLADRLKDDGQELLGIDAAAGMIHVANGLGGDPRLGFSTAAAERLPYAEGYFDLVISTTSFDHWKDQAGGIRECFRVLAPGGYFVLTDLFSVLWLPTLLLSRRNHARTKRRAGALLRDGGFCTVKWHPIYRGIIAAAAANKEQVRT